MRRLLNSNHQTLVPHLEVANTLWTRTKGLLGRRHLPPDQALWILSCNSVHTFFMQFAIDLVFLNRELVVTKVYSGVQPGRLILPVWGATSVVELSDGFLARHPVQVGEKLNVDPALS